MLPEEIITPPHALPELPPSENQNQAFDAYAKAKAVALRNKGYKYKEIATHLKLTFIP